MRTIALLLFAASIAPAAEPRFQVENKVTPKAPAFVVVNKAAYTPPNCTQCNTGNNQCACPLSYGSCRCGEIKPAEVRQVPFGYPGFRHPGLTQTTNAMPAAGASTSSRVSMPTGLIRIGVPVGMYGGTNCGPSG